MNSKPCKTQNCAKLTNECAKTAKTLMQPQHETHTKNNTKKQMKPTWPCVQLMNAHTLSCWASGTITDHRTCVTRDSNPPCATCPATLSNIHIPHTIHTKYTHKIHTDTHILHTKTHSHPHAHTHAHAEATHEHKGQYIHRFAIPSFSCTYCHNVKSLYDKYN